MPIANNFVKLGLFLMIFTMYISESTFLSIKFGELQLSSLTVYLLIGTSVFVFLAVGISSFKLIQSAFSSEEEEG